MVLQAGSGSESAAGYYPVYGVELEAQMCDRDSAPKYSF